MDQTDAIEIEGQIEVVGVNLPQDMEQDDRLRAQQSKVSDVLVVLERNHASVERALADGIATELPEGIEATTTLSFANTGAGFNVSVSPVASGAGKIDRRRLTHVLPGRVTSVMTECIGANATRVGIWEPKVVAEIKGRSRPTEAQSGDVKTSTGLGHIGWVLGVLGVGAGLIALMLMQ
ncbi:MAG: hypothetical protein AAGB04_11125 [Pseudomonadota bacterium]